MRQIFTIEFFDKEFQNNPRMPLILQGLAAEAIKAGSWENFKYDFTIQIKHGLYWHWTDNQDFDINQYLGPRDLSSMSASTGIRVGELMITSDIHAWSEYGGQKGLGRKYAGLIDMSYVPRHAYYQVGRGFGNELIVTDPTNACVIDVLPRTKAFRKDQRQNKYLPRSEEELYEFFIDVMKMSRP